jgi:hypothetical protein
VAQQLNLPISSRELSSPPQPRGIANAPGAVMRGIDIVKAVRHAASAMRRAAAARDAALQARCAALDEKDRARALRAQAEHLRLTRVRRARTVDAGAMVEQRLRS